MQEVGTWVLQIVLMATPFQIVGTLLATVLGPIATWYISQNLAKWVQAYRNRQNQAETERLRKEAEELVRKHQAESDKLKEIEGR